jgi:hypothetical protein
VEKNRWIFHNLDLRRWFQEHAINAIIVKLNSAMTPNEFRDDYFLKKSSGNEKSSGKSEIQPFFAQPNGL